MTGISDPISSRLRPFGTAIGPVRELLDRQRFATHADARAGIFDFIEGWYNPRRRHSALDYVSPAAYEQRAWSTT